MEYISENSDVIPNTVCQQLIEKFENDFIVPTNDDNTSGMNISLDESNGWDVECTYLHEVLMIRLYEYIEMLKLNVFEDKKNILYALLTGPKIVRTTFKMKKIGVKDSCDWHTDYSHDMDRILSFVIYLNENESCTEFLNGRKIKPRVGKIAFFPSTWTYTHRCQPIEKGVKYVISGFIFYNNLHDSKAAL
jgi:hypothetical protein